MPKTIRNAMRTGIVQFMAYPTTMSGNGPVLESIDELVADDFFDAIEVTHIEGASIRKEVAKRVRVAGMDLAFGTQPMVLSRKLNLHSREAGERQKSLDTIVSALEEAVEMGAVGFATMSGPDPGESHRGEETKLFADSLRSICQRAAELKPDMNVVVESFDRVPFGKNCLVGPTKEAVELIQTVRRDYPRFGLMLDLSHLPLLGETSEESIPLAAPVLLHSHVGNCVMRDSENPYYGDNHPPFDYEGSENGVNELIGYLIQLHKVGYLSWEKPPIVTTEAKPLSDGMRPAMMGNLKRTMNRAIARIDSGLE